MLLLKKEDYFYIDSGQIFNEEQWQELEQLVWAENELIKYYSFSTPYTTISSIYEY